MCPLLFNHSYAIWQLWILQGCPPFGIFKILNDGWMECITCVAFSWTVFSKLVFLSFQFRFPWGPWPFQIPIRKLKGSYIFNSEFCTFLTWCKATSLSANNIGAKKTTSPNDDQVLSVAEISRLCKKSPYENVLAQMETLAGCWEKTLVSCLMSSRIASTSCKRWLLCLHFKTTIIFLPEKSMLTLLNDDCCLELTLVLMKCFKLLVVTYIKASIPPTLVCLQSELFYCAYHNILLPLGYFPTAQ